MQMIDIECDTRQDARQVQPVKIVAGNKCDLKEGRAISSRQGLEYARAKGCGFMETSAREMVNIEETFARKPLSTSILDWSIIKLHGPCAAKSLRVLMHYGGLVIVRRVVAARQAHASGSALASPQSKTGLFSHGHSGSRPQTSNRLGEKETTNVTEFPERPGARKTNRGGFWAKFKCW